MAVILVTYDLRAPGRNYDGVHEYLEQYDHCRGLESVWLLDTDRTCAQIRDDLNKYIDENDTTFVVTLQGDCSAYNYNCTDWLVEPGRSG